MMLKLGLVEVQGFAPGGGVIQTLQGVWHGPLCSDGRPMGENGAALPGQADRSGPDRNGWAVVPWRRCCGLLVQAAPGVICRRPSASGTRCSSATASG